MTRPGKPAGLVTRAETKAQKQARADKEAALRPAGELPMEAPSLFDAQPTAAAVWRRLMRHYASLDAAIVTKLDQDLLVSFCELVEELVELRLLRKKLAEEMAAATVIDEPRAELLLKLDGRCDRKRDLLHKHMQSLYLTPRARAGTAPRHKEPERPKSALAELLDDVTDFVNGEGDE